MSIYIYSEFEKESCMYVQISTDLNISNKIMSFEIAHINPYFQGFSATLSNILILALGFRCRNLKVNACVGFFTPVSIAF